jgi:hypothetical protein
MSLARRSWIAGALGVLALALYVADLMGLKPPPRILPSVVLAVAAVAIGVRPRRADGAGRTGEADGQDAADGVSTRRWMTIAGFVLLTLLLVYVVPIGLVAPAEGIIAIQGLWLAGFIVAWRLRRANPPVVLATPFVVAALHAATLWMGSTYLGWAP